MSITLLSRIIEAWTWFLHPSVIPWAGVIAAIVAALTVETKSWLKSPLRSIRRALQVAGVWLVIALFFGWALQPGDGGGVGGGGESEADSAAKETPQVTVIPGQPVSGVLEHFDLVISFTPSPGNQSIALDFSCDMQNKITKSESTKTEIRAGNMHEFDKLLVEKLREVDIPQHTKRLVVLIKPLPFPGESVLRRVNEKIRLVLPNAIVKFDESNAP